MLHTTIFSFGGILSFLACLPLKNPNKTPEGTAAAMEFKKICCNGGTWLTVDVWGFLSVGSRACTQHLSQKKCLRGKMDEKVIGNVMPVSSVVCYSLNLYIATEFPRLSVFLLLCPV